MVWGGLYWIGSTGCALELGTACSTRAVRRFTRNTMLGSFFDTTTTKTHVERFFFSAWSSLKCSTTVQQQQCRCNYTQGQCKLAVKKWFGKMFASVWYKWWILGKWDETMCIPIQFGPLVVWATFVKGSVFCFIGSGVRETVSLCDLCWKYILFHVYGAHADAGLHGEMSGQLWWNKMDEWRWKGEKSRGKSQSWNCALFGVHFRTCF